MFLFTEKHSSPERLKLDSILRSVGEISDGSKVESMCNFGFKVFGEFFVAVVFVSRWAFLPLMLTG